MPPSRNGQSEYLKACKLDRAGRETQAIPHYRRGLLLGLPVEKRRSALLGLGSSLRNVGRHAEAVCTLRDAVSEFPTDAALLAFFALALYSNGNAKEAVSVLLDVTIRYAPVGRYSRALKQYLRVLPPMVK
jgi:tetratricopeptide (TPR) repeat protein